MYIFSQSAQSNRPFARSGHMVQNHTCWWASCAAGLSQRVALFWKTHFTTRSSACAMLYVTGSCKGPIGFGFFMLYKLWSEPEVVERYIIGVFHPTCGRRGIFSPIHLDLRAEEHCGCVAVDLYILGAGTPSVSPRFNTSTVCSCCDARPW